MVTSFCIRYLKLQGLGAIPYIVTDLDSLEGGGNSRIWQLVHSVGFYGPLAKIDPITVDYTICKVSLLS